MYTDKDAAESSPPFQLLVSQAPEEGKKRKIKSTFFLEADLEGLSSQMMTYKMLPVSAIQPKRHAWELNSEVPPELQRRDSKQQKSLRP